MEIERYGLCTVMRLWVELYSLSRFDCTLSDGLLSVATVLSGSVNLLDDRECLIVLCLSCFELLHADMKWKGSGFHHRWGSNMKVFYDPLINDNKRQNSYLIWLEEVILFIDFPFELSFASDVLGTTKIGDAELIWGSLVWKAHFQY